MFAIEIYFHPETLKLGSIFRLKVHSDLDTGVYLTSRGDIKNIALLMAQ